MKKIMYTLLIYSLFFWACNNSANKTESKGDSINSKLVLIDSLALRSTGLYSGYVPCADCPGIITHLLLNPDMTYRLEEVYSKKEDKVQRTNGSWKMENGKIELYENNDPVVSYLSEGENLLQLDHAGNRISGNLGHKYVLTRKLLADKKNWKEKTDAGVDFIGLGNEPFWSLEIDKGYKITFNNPDMKEPFIGTYIAPTSLNDNQEYHIESGTSKLDIIITPQFCSDGMSDNVYAYSISLEYNGKKYSGCGVLLNTL